MVSDSLLDIDDDSPLSSPSNDSPVLKTPSVELKAPAHKVFVALPRLSAQDKLLYKPMNKSSFGSDFETRVDEVIGEYREGIVHYYFARYDGGIAYKYLAPSFAGKYGDLVQKYNRKKAEGTLAPFDPSAQYIHPLSRVKVRIRITSDRISQTPRSENGTGDIVPDSEEEGYTEESEETEEDDNKYYGKKLRSQTRVSVRPKLRDLPFSPRKNRSRKVLTIDSDTSVTDEDFETSNAQRRRFTRSRKVMEIELDSDADYAGAQPAANARRIKLLGPKKKAPRSQSLVPMYGRVRDIKSIDEDPFSDDDGREVLRVHRKVCEKCHDRPAHQMLEAFRRKSKGKGKKRKRSTDDDFEWSDDEEKFLSLGGWVQCLKCPVAAHWQCLGGTQQDELLKAIREKDWEPEGQQPEGCDPIPTPKKRAGLDIGQMTEFVCASCTRGGICMGCMETALKPVVADQAIEVETVARPTKSGDITMGDDSNTVDSSQPSSNRVVSRELFFRCLTCKRLAHYSHLPKPLGFEDTTVSEVAEHYQTAKNWLCADCSSYKYGLDKIIAWRPYPSSAVEPAREPDVLPNYKAQLPREYLVKWSGRSYRRLDWIPHMWLLSTSPGKLKHFVAGGTKVELLKEPINDDKDAMDVDNTGDLPIFEKVVGSSRSSSVKPDSTTPSPSGPMPDAEKRIPLPWTTTHRVLDVLLWRPIKKGGSKRKKRRVVEISDDEEVSDRYANEKRTTFEKGKEPPADLTQTADEWEERKDLQMDDVRDVAWAFIKWDELGYEESSWDAPPCADEAGYEAFRIAFEKFIEARRLYVPRRDKAFYQAFDKRGKDAYRKSMLNNAADLDLGQSKTLKLLPFQVDGFNWLCNNWWNHQHCILADEMGLGKTVQIVSFLGNIALNWKAYPALVVVPNSTITNWVREFERWTPKLRVVPYYGEKNARDVIKEFELFHKSAPSGGTETKFHVLITTYEAITNSRDGPVFKSQPRWEVLIIDEGQRLKSDSSLLFKKLNELNSAHRIIMTGTPLNNNIRELFNLMNFLDPEEWRDLEALEKQHEVLNEGLVKELHNRLRPYFLRRVKGEVLELPPKNEVIVPLSMAPLQREVYRSILSNNLDILKGLTQPSYKQNAPAKTRINNVLMQLRKCLQHPYLYAQDIEPMNLPSRETHEKLIDGSAKFRFLKTLLPKLKERGHRILLFSQFVIALNVIEDFLIGEKIKYLRLDGSTKGSVRQKYMDEFNKPGSDYFIFLLTTRAGGVGINLYTADTVIIFDPDFNPHQDLQAIARAYRYGQKKTCLVFKLMVKDSAEERIIQIGKKKLVLDHLIVQKMDDDEEHGGENVKSILTHGAQALFESDQSSRDITYSDQDVEKLIEKTQREAVQEGLKAGGSGLSFSFAKVWSADKHDLEEVVEEDQTDSWAQALEKLNEERQKEHNGQLAESGRGVRRRAADIAKKKMNSTTEGSRDIVAARKKSQSASEYSDVEMDSEHESDLVEEPDKAHIQEANTLDSDQSTVPAAIRDCGLCGQQHGDSECAMVERSENLAEYREMLINHADDEPWEERRAAVQAIDNILKARDHVHLIAGQPLLPLLKALPRQPFPKKMKRPTVPQGTSGKSTNHASSQERLKVKNPPNIPSPCVLCSSPRPHFYKDCDVVRLGSKSIINAIQTLENRKDASLTSVIDTLRVLLAKAKNREMANENRNGGNAVAGPSKLS